MATLKRKAITTAPRLSNTVMRTPYGVSKQPKISTLPYKKEATPRVQKLTASNSVKKKRS